MSEKNIWNRKGQPWLRYMAKAYQCTAMYCSAVILSRTSTCWPPHRPVKLAGGASRIDVLQPCTNLYSRISYAPNHSRSGTRNTRSFLVDDSHSCFLLTGDLYPRRHIELPPCATPIGHAMGKPSSSNWPEECRKMATCLQGSCLLKARSITQRIFNDGHYQLT